jgi:hypothetical protein
MWLLMLLLVVGEGEPARSVISEHPTRGLCALAAHTHRVKVVRADPANTIRVYRCVQEEKKP